MVKLVCYWAADLWLVKVLNVRICAIMFGLVMFTQIHTNDHMLILERTIVQGHFVKFQDLIKLSKKKAFLYI